MAVNGSSFISPHFIEELGCDGLTAEEIALSLNAPVDAVRKKIRYGFSERLKSLNLLCRRMKNINGVEFDEFFLSTQAAKFFVARYDNEIGDAYLSYLLAIEDLFETLLDKIKIRRLSYADVISIIEEAPLISLENESLKQERAAAEEADNEPITKEEYELLDRTANATLRHQGRFREAYKRGFKREILSKFYLPGEREGTYTYLPRKNYKAALLHARDRVFDWTTTREFIE